MPSVNPLERNQDNLSEKNLPRQQKMAVVFLAFLSIGIIVIWALQLNSQLKKPYGTDKPIAAKTDTVATTTNLSTQDTDGDGLTDYDEINIYHTSPYLEDSDGDGISDKQEIAQGTDPNCPTGKDCSALEAQLTASSTVVSSTLETINPNGAVTSSEAATVASTGTVTPAMLRQILLQDGTLDQATIDKFSDEDLMNSYQQAIKTQNASSTSTVNK